VFARPWVGVGAIEGTCNGLVAIGIIGVVVLAIDAVLPWLARGYVVLCLLVGIPGLVAAGAYRRRAAEW
jgi:hypothetical protein